jgi:hypothetical protein
MQADTNLCACPSERKVKVKTAPTTLFSALLIAILPKCPFCMLAYSSAITVCSTKAMVHTTGWSSYISITLAVITLLIVLYNYKGRRTIVAASFILIGTMIIAYSELYSGQVSHYYIGGVILFIGAWANGSLLFFVKLLKSFSKKKIEVSIHG